MQPEVARRPLARVREAGEHDDHLGQQDVHEAYYGARRQARLVRVRVRVEVRVRVWVRVRVRVRG